MQERMARQDSQIAAFTNANWNHGARLQRMEAVVAQLPSAALAQRIAQLEMAVSTLVPGHKQVWYNSTDRKGSTLSGAWIVGQVSGAWQIWFQIIWKLHAPEECSNDLGCPEKQWSWLSISKGR